MTLRVYLDSSDYSVMSDTARLTPQLSSIRDQLLSWSVSGEVEFRYSAAHILEMSPLDAAYNSLAEARAALLVALCGTKAFISFDRVVSSEMSALAEKNEPSDIISDRGDWFPDMEGVISPLSGVEKVNAFDDVAKAEGRNRAERRAAHRRAFKNGKPRKATKQIFGNSEESTLQEMLALYPMREQDARVLVRYIAGTASKAEAEEAFVSSLRDPTWMMKWFEKHSDKLTPVIQWLRAPSEDFRQAVAAIAQQAARLYELTGNAGYEDSTFPDFSQRRRQQMQTGLLHSISTRLADKVSIQVADTDAELMSRHAPGLSVCVKTAVDSMWASLNKNPRPPKPSDFGDLVHAIYAPYTDVFRTDKYMAPLVATNAKMYGTTVVGRLVDIVDVIARKLAE
jgi:hypothetical protein